MVKPIVKDVIFLGGKSEAAAAEDKAVADDLLDTLRANADRCVGMAANMIGVKKRIIVISDGGVYTEMFNPELIRAADAFTAEEGCLSLTGTRQTKRFRSIRVRYQTRTMQTRIKSYTGWTAQIIQHELDHLDGIII